MPVCGRPWRGRLLAAAGCRARRGRPLPRPGARAAARRSRRRGRRPRGRPQPRGSRTRTRGRAPRRSGGGSGAERWVTAKSTDGPGTSMTTEVTARKRSSWVSMTGRGRRPTAGYLRALMLRSGGAHARPLWDDDGIGGVTGFGISDASHPTSWCPQVDDARKVARDARPARQPHSRIPHGDHRPPPVRGEREGGEEKTGKSEREKLTDEDLGKTRQAYLVDAPLDPTRLPAEEETTHFKAFGAKEGHGTGRGGVALIGLDPAPRGPSSYLGGPWSPSSTAWYDPTPGSGRTRATTRSGETPAASPTGGDPSVTSRPSSRSASRSWTRTTRSSPTRGTGPSLRDWCARSPPTRVCCRCR